MIYSDRFCLTICVVGSRHNLKHPRNPIIHDNQIYLKEKKRMETQIHDEF